MTFLRSIICFVLCMFCFANSAYAATKPTIYKFDLRTLQNNNTREYIYDLRHAAVCIQGLVNRDAPRLFLIMVDDDAVWYDRLMETGGLCEGWNVVRLNNMSQLVGTFRPYINGVVLYDPDPNTGVLSTSLVATTIAGIEGGIAVRKDLTAYMYNLLTGSSSGLKLPVIKDLTNMFTGTGTIPETNTPSTLSRKCDAYIWAKEKYLDTGLCDTSKLMYSLDLWACFYNRVNRDKAGTANLDYAVCRKAFCFELSPWDDEYPNDDPNQPLGTDRNTFRAILNACNIQNNYNKMIKFCGYINWDQKYTNNNGTTGSHDPVATEWKLTELLGVYNTFMEADGLEYNYVSNTSFYNALLPAIHNRRFVQNPAPTYNELVSKGYISATGSVVPNHYALMYMGDYDGVSGMMCKFARGLYDDPNRGQLYCSWAITPNSIDRGLIAFDYIYRHKTAKDFFIAGDSGAGYINPSELYGSRSPSGYPSAVSIWQKHCREYYRPLDYSITGWLLNGNAGSVTLTDAQNYVPFSGDGIGIGNFVYSQKLVNNVAAINRDTDDNDDAYHVDQDYYSGVVFDWYRYILKSPSYIKGIEDSLGSEHKFVDAYTFYYLLRYYLGGNNNYRATWVGDTIPRIMEKSRSYPVTITVRNDGWDTWSESAGYRLAYAIVPQGATPAYSDYDQNGRFIISDGNTVASAKSYVFNVTITAPSTTGNYDIYYDMVRDDYTWFRVANNIEWKSELIVANNETDIDTDGDGVPDVIEDSVGTLYWHPDDSVQCGDAGYLISDISGQSGMPDCYVNFYDVQAVAAQWLSTDASATADIIDEGTVNLVDFSKLAEEWMLCNDPENSQCWANIN